MTHKEPVIADFFVTLHLGSRILKNAVDHKIGKIAESER